MTPWVPRRFAPRNDIRASHHLSHVLLALLLVATLGGCLPRRGEQETVVFAAASLADALGEIKERYEAGGGSAVMAVKLASAAS